MLKLIYFVTSEMYSISSVSLLKIFDIANRLDYLVLKKFSKIRRFVERMKLIYTIVCVSTHKCSGNEVSKVFE